MPKPRVAVVICTYNDGVYLRACLDALLAQTYKDFTLLLVDDGSTDDTQAIVRSYKDKRIRYERQKTNSGSLGEIRKKAVSLLPPCEYVLVTDGDCAVHPRWVEAMVAALMRSNALAVEGKLVYVREDFNPSFAERVTENLHGGLYMTANMGYTRDVLNRYSFDASVDGLEDRDLALRILREGPIEFAPEAIVYHQQKRWTPKSYMRDSQRVVSKVRIIKRYHDYRETVLRVLYPARLVLVVFPPLLLWLFIRGKVRSWEDLRLVPCAYAKAVYVRYLIWRTALQERVFVL